MKHSPWGSVVVWRRPMATFWILERQIMEKEIVAAIIGADGAVIAALRPSGG
jgi:hypothetical protein